MWAHDLLIAIRRLRAAPFTTLANVVTLAVGLACFIAAYGVATYWRSGDADTARSDRVVLISLRFEPVGQTSVRGVLSPATMGRYLREELPELAHLTRATGVFDVTVAAGDEEVLLDAAYVDAELFELFDLELAAGDARTALAAPGGVVLAASVAAQLFGTEPALGKAVRVDDAWDGTVTGVLAPIPQPSFMGAERGVALPFSMLSNRAAPTVAQSDARDNWFATQSFTLAERPANMTLDALNAQLEAFAERHRPPQIQGAMIVEALPVGEVTTIRLNAQLLSRSGIGLSAVSVLLGLGLLTLAIAAVSYANLASAQAAARAKEIGMRRVLGSGRAHVLAQAWLEALLQTAIAAALALAALAALRPWVEASSDIGVLYFLTRGAAPFVVLAAVVAAVSLGAAAYPALVLARIPPLDAVQPGRSRGGPRLVAQVLVGMQFASTSFLLIVVAIMHLQRSALEDVALLPHRDPVIVLNDVRRAGVDFTTLATELRRIPTVKNVASISATPWGGATETIRYARDPTEAADAPLALWRNGSAEYFAALGIELLAGRVFDRARDTKPGVLYSADETNNTLIVVDRVYAQRLGFATPADAVDQLVYVPDSLQRNRQAANQPPAPPARIIGVTEAETTHLESGAASGVVHVFAPELRATRQVPLVRVAREDLRGTVAAVARTWETLAPSVPVNIRFFDDLFEQRYRSFAAVGQLFVWLAASAAVIAAIGQLGIAVHVAGRRRREVGVRKTLGSTTPAVARLMLVDFGKPVLLANLAAWPLAYIVAGAYLRAFAYRIDVTAGPFALSLVCALAIAFGAVAAVVLKTARLPPAEVLRHV